MACTVAFLKRSPRSTAAPREAARQPVPRPMAAVAASLKRVWGLILGYWGGGGEGVGFKKKKKDHPEQLMSPPYPATTTHILL